MTPDIKNFYQQIMGFSPNPLQQQVWGQYYGSDHPALLIRAGTGTGKTEAILLPALADPSQPRVIMVLPSKALIEDLAQRVAEIARNISKHNSKSINITVDMGGRCWRLSCYGGQTYNKLYHRHLFADDIILTTLDKFLFRLFGYGEAIKSYIFPHRIFGSSLGKRPFVVFDEAHDYERLAYSNFAKLLEALYIKGKNLGVMSATLPAGFSNFLTIIDATQGILGEAQNTFQRQILDMVHPQKRLTLIPASNLSSSKRAEYLEIMAAEVKQRYRPKNRMIVRTEWISDLLALYPLIADCQPLIYHGRLTSEQRTEVIKEIISREKKGEGYLVLATAAIEAGCDLDAHCIVTEICLPDSLVQLAGRLNRRGKNPEAELVVIGNTIKSSTLEPGTKKESIKNYFQTLENMEVYFQPEKLAPFFYPPKRDWMGEVLFDMLWDYVYEADLTCKPLWDRGIMVTRSWEPSVTLCTGLDPITKRAFNPIEVSLSRFAVSLGSDDEDKEVMSRFSLGGPAQWHASLQRAYFNTYQDGESRWSIYPFAKDDKSPRYSSYENTFLCVIEPEHVADYFDPKLGYIRIPKIMLQGWRSGFKRFFHYQPKFKKDGALKKTGNKIDCGGYIWFLER